MNTSSEELNWKLLDIASHELRNPLATILGFCELLASEEDAEKRQLYLGYIRDKTLDMNGLVLQLLDISRHHLGKAMPTQRQKVSIESHLQTLLKDYLSEGSYRIETDLEPCSLMLDKARFQIVVKEVLSNALRFGKRIPRVFIRGKVEGDFYILAFEDNGPGMTEEVKTRAFELFFAQNSLQGKSAGVGMGLASVGAIMKAHEGSASMGDAPGGGTAVILCFPLNPQG